MASKADAVKTFLDEVLEGYHFADIDNMMKITLIKGRASGAAGWPIALTLCSVIELLGYVVCTVNKTNGKYIDRVRPGSAAKFSSFWDDYLSKVNAKYEGLGRLAYNLLRNGLAHSGVTKPGLMIWKGNPSDHLTFEKTPRMLSIDVTQLDIDVRKVYRDEVLVLLDSSHITFDSGKVDEMYCQIDELQRAYGDEADSDFNTAAVKDWIRRHYAYTPVPSAPVWLSPAYISSIQSNGGTASPIQTSASALMPSGGAASV